ncbi:sugar ABC transporter permease [Planosporangium thailandense]|uniref:Xylose transport system permease protein XylH n=1 Tax=Planosporangium thailandense TaxID=765197 RepID=A0ABX0XVB0_9ACTN|nr:sugar ABC transporter permease [Planosporangium thailandense]NJC69974.1 sugar ABC transporter permease [Planosporangium thailandense]
MTTQTVNDTALPGAAAEEAGGLRDKLRLLMRGDSASHVGVTQVLVGLAAIWIVFSLLNPNFVSPTNLTNLALQIVAVATMSIGVVLVLLIGEIDLSVGSVSGLAATVMAALNVKQGMPAFVAIGLALLCGLVVGLIHGTIIATFGVPSFVVTLAGLIGWQGLQLLIFDYTGAMNLGDPKVLALTDTFFQPWAGLVATVVIALAMGLVTRRRRARRRELGLGNRSAAFDVVRLVAFAIVVAVLILVFGINRGIPLSVLIVVGLVVLMDFIARRTLFGRRIYAVGGDAQAAERVGTNVKRVTIQIFVLASFFAALGGVLSASRLMSVSQSAGGGEVLLDAIAGVVIGGTSLFGGRGSVWSALLGALVIGSISNGMDLLALRSPVKLMITGAVLVAAVIFDAVMRRRQSR